MLWCEDTEELQILKKIANFVRLYFPHITTSLNNFEMIFMVLL